MENKPCGNCHKDHEGRTLCRIEGAENETPMNHKTSECCEKCTEYAYHPSNPSLLAGRKPEKYKTAWCKSSNCLCHTQTSEKGCPLHKDPHNPQNGLCTCNQPTQTLSTVLEEQERLFDEKFPQSCSVRGCNGHCLTGHEKKQFLLASNRTVIKKVLNQLDSLESGIDMGLFKDSGKLVIKHLQKILQESIKEL